MRREHEEAAQRVDVHWQMDQQMAPLNSQIKKLQMQKRGLQLAQFDLHLYSAGSEPERALGMAVDEASQLI